MGRCRGLIHGLFLWRRGVDEAAMLQANWAKLTGKLRAHASADRPMGA